MKTMKYNINIEKFNTAIDRNGINSMNYHAQSYVDVADKFVHRWEKRYELGRSSAADLEEYFSELRMIMSRLIRTWEGDVSEALDWYGFREDGFFTEDEQGRRVWVETVPDMTIFGHLQRVVDRLDEAGYLMLACYIEHVLHALRKSHISECKQSWIMHWLQPDAIYFTPDPE